MGPARVRRPFGTIPVFGEFLEIERPERLSMILRAFPGMDGRWGIEHVSTFGFEDAPGGGTIMRMTTVVRQVSEAILPAVAGMEEGWSQSFEKLNAMLSETA